MDGLSSPMQALLSSLILNYAYRSRQTVRDVSMLAPLYFIIDDGLPLAFGSASVEAEGGISVLSEFAFMARSRRMALVISSQVFGLLSPAIRANCPVTLCLGAYGRDADEVARHLNLTREQAQVLPFLRIGEAVARCAPLPAMLGSVPFVR